MEGQYYYSVGAAVVYKRTNTAPQWTERQVSFKYADTKHEDVELIAISLALELGLQEHARRTLEKLPPLYTIVVYSDGQHDLHRIRGFTSYSRKRRLDTKIQHTQILSRIFGYSHDLHDLGVTIGLSWVPGHTGVKGNERADYLAGQAARRGYEHSSDTAGNIQHELEHKSKRELSSGTLRVSSKRQRRKLKCIKDQVLLSTTRQATETTKAPSASAQKIVFVD